MSSRLPRRPNCRSRARRRRRPRDRWGSRSSRRCRRRSRRTGSHRPRVWLPRWAPSAGRYGHLPAPRDRSRAVGRRVPRPAHPLRPAAPRGHRRRSRRAQHSEAHGNHRRAAHGRAKNGHRYARAQRRHRSPSGTGHPTMYPSAGGAIAAQRAATAPATFSERSRQETAGVPRRPSALPGRLARALKTREGLGRMQRAPRVALQGSSTAVHVVSGDSSISMLTSYD